MAIQIDSHVLDAGLDAILDANIFAAVRQRSKSYAVHTKPEEMIRQKQATAAWGYIAKGASVQ